ncbi:TrkH family potassium uptake protein [Natronospora cellulosivora (SeqCode)]
MGLYIYRKKLYTIIIINSYLLIVLSGILTIPLIYSIILQESKTTSLAFLLAILIAFVPGIFMKYHYKFFSKKKNLNLNISTSMMAVSCAWILSSFIGAIPLFFGLELTLIDALFEGVSAFTTTDFTTLKNFDLIPKSLLLWRALMQWLGGLGILTFFLLISTRFAGNMWQLFSAESHKVNSSRPVPNISNTIKILWTIYILFTIIQSILLFIFKVPLFDAVIHSLTSISTGGFSHYENSIGHYALTGHPYYRQIEYIIIAFMLLGGINFLLHYKVLTGNFKAPLQNTEFKAFIKIIAFTTLLIMLAIILNNKEHLKDLENLFRTVLFQVVSILTTAGYETQEISSSFFPVVARQAFLILMLIGGSVGSTSGGVKVLRIVILKRLFSREIKKTYYPPHSVLPVTLDQNIIDTEEIYRIATMLFAWVLVIVCGGLISSFFSNMDAFQSLSVMFSAVGNIGPHYGDPNMADLAPVLKLTYMIAMLAGRLEILPLFILFSKNTWKSQ